MVTALYYTDDVHDSNFSILRGIRKTGMIIIVLVPQESFGNGNLIRIRRLAYPMYVTCETKYAVAVCDKRIVVQDGIVKLQDV